MITKSLHDVTFKQDGDEGQISAVFSVFDVIDADGDVVRKGAFADQDGQSVVLSAYQHGSWDGALPIGKGIIRERKADAVFEGSFFLDTTHGADAYRTIKQLAEAGLQEWSYSLERSTTERGEFDGRQVRFINKTFVKEVSPVLRGSNPLTETLAVKSGDLKFSDHREKVLTDLDGLTKRCMEVVTLRAAEGKACPSADELLDELEARVKALRDGLTVATTPQSSVDDAIREWMRSVAISQGVTLS